MSSLFDFVKDLGDSEFEATVAQLRTLRRAHQEEIAYVRQMHTATFGLSAKYDEMARRTGTERLIAALVSAGFSRAAALKQVPELDRG